MVVMFALSVWAEKKEDKEGRQPDTVLHIGEGTGKEDREPNLSSMASAYIVDGAALTTGLHGHRCS